MSIHLIFERCFSLITAWCAQFSSKSRLAYCQEIQLKMVFLQIVRQIWSFALKGPELLSGFCHKKSDLVSSCTPAVRSRSYFGILICFLIIDAPLITTHPQVVGPVTEDDNVTLSCNASGDPVPSITWTRDGSLLNSSLPRISFGAKSRELTIKSVNRADSGEYRCVADNSEGNVTSNSTTLDVQCKYSSLIKDIKDIKDLTKLLELNFFLLGSCQGFSPVELRSVLLTLNATS